MAAVTRGGFVATRTVLRPDAPNPELKTPAAIVAFLEGLAGQLLRGTLPSRTASALVAVAGAAIRAHDQNIAQRLAELEELAASRAKGIDGAVIITHESPKALQPGDLVDVTREERNP